jgi:3D (Asp-Asp-Asp) domain-containing protein
MTRKTKAILVLLFAAEIINSAKVGMLKSRIADLETQRDIYASRAQNWINRAVEDEEVIDSLQVRLDETADRKVELTDAGTFFCTAYCTEQYEHICGEGHGITASGQPIQAGVTVAADQSIFPYGTVLYIDGIGIRIVQDKGSAIQENHLDVAVDTHENAKKWSGYGNHRVWIVKESVQ